MRPKQTEAKVPSEEMRKRAREWLYNADHPNECASQGEVDDLATLLDEVRASEREACARVCDRRFMALIPTDDELEHDRGLEAKYLAERIRARAQVSGESPK